MGRRRRERHLIFAAASLAAPLLARGQVSGTWLNPYGGTWTDPTNWNSDPAFPDGGGTATFPGNTWNTTPIFLGNTTISLTRIVLDGPSIHAIGSTGTLVFSGPAVLDINGPVAQPPSISPFSGASTIRNISTTAGLIKNGTGAMMASALTGVSGGITINDGALITGGNYPIFAGNGTVTLNGGELRCADFAFPASTPFVIGSGGGLITAGSATVSLANILNGSSSLTLAGSGPTGFQISLASNFSGSVQLLSPLKLTGSAGALASASSFALADNLNLANGTSGTSGNRVNDTAPIVMAGGMISGVGSTSSPMTETLGSVTLDHGLNTIGSDANLTISLTSLARANHSVLSMGTAAFSLQVAGTPPALAGSGATGTPDVGVVPWIRAEGASMNPVTVAAGVLRPLGSSEFITSIPSGMTTSNLKLTADATITSPATVNSLTISPPAFFANLSGSSTLSVTSGAVFVIAPPSGQATHNVVVAPLDFGSAEAILHTNLPSSNQVDFTGPISGSNGLTVAGGLSLRGSSTYTGQTTVLGRLYIMDDVTAGQAGPLGLDTSPVVVDGNSSGGGITFVPAASTTLHFDRNLTLNSFNSYGSITLGLGSATGGAGSAIISSNIQINGAVGLVGSAKPGPDGYVFSGHISGPGRLVNPVNVTLTGSNSFSGGVLVNNAVSTLQVGNDSALGTGTLWLTGIDASTMAATIPVTLSNPVVVAGLLRTAGTQTITFAGPMNLYGGTRTIVVGNTATLNMTGDVFNGGISKLGGLLQNSRVNVPTLSISSGIVRIRPNGTNAATSRVQSLTISSATFAQLDLTDNDLIYDYPPTAGAPAPMTAVIKAHLIAGRLISSTADGVTTGLGYADNSVLGRSTFDGQAIDASTVLVKYTFIGDSNLDGIVDIRDLTALALHLNTGSSLIWTDGDFNNDGHVNTTDLAMLAHNWQAGTGASLGPSLQAALADLGLPSSSVPEPIGLGLVSFIALQATRRRRLARASD